MYGVVEAVLDVYGITIGLDATVLTELLVAAWAGALAALQDGGAPSPPALLRAAANVTDGAGANFLAPALAVYVTLAHVATLITLLCAVALVAAAIILKVRPEKAFVARGIAFGAWVASVLSTAMRLLVPFSQMVPFPSCPELDPGAVCTPADLQLLYVLEKQVVGLLFGLISLLGALPYVVFVVPVWVRCAKLIVGAFVWCAVFVSCGFC